MGGESCDQLEWRESLDMFLLIIGGGVGIGDLLVLSVIVEPGERYGSTGGIALRGPEGVWSWGPMWTLNPEWGHESMFWATSSEMSSCPTNASSTVRRKSSAISMGESSEAERKEPSERKRTSATRQWTCGW
jgi:hypothetical protein